MTIYKQDAQDLAALETQIAAAIKATNPGGLLEQHPAIWHAYRTSSARAAALAQIALTLPDGPTSTGGGTATPTPTPTASQTTMPAFGTGSFAASGKVAKVDYQQDTGSATTPSWNPFWHDTQTADQAVLLHATTNASTGWYMAGRTGNMASANGNGSAANPANSGPIPDAVMVSNHTNYATYPINDAIAGLNPNYAYDLQIYGSRQQTPSMTQYTVGNPSQAALASQTLDASYNTSRSVTFAKVKPAPNGVIYFTWLAAEVSPGVLSDQAVIAALILTEYRPS